MSGDEEGKRDDGETGTLYSEDVVEKRGLSIRFSRTASALKLRK